MKVEVNEKEPSNEIKFPCLMKSFFNEEIVLFQSETTGTVIQGGKIGRQSGKCYDDWDIRAFTPFNGTITLQND